MSVAETRLVVWHPRIANGSLTGTAVRPIGRLAVLAVVAAYVALGAAISASD